MSSDVAALTDAPVEEPVGRATLALVAFGPMALFSAHLVVAYAVISLRCDEGILAGGPRGVDAARWVVLGMSVAGAVLLAALAGLAHRRRAALARDSSDANGRARFLLLGATVLSALLVAYMVLAAVMVAVVPACTP